MCLPLHAKTLQTGGGSPSVEFSTEASGIVGDQGSSDFRVHLLREMPHIQSYKETSEKTLLDGWL